MSETKSHQVDPTPVRNEQEEVDFSHPKLTAYSESDTLNQAILPDPSARTRMIEARDALIASLKANQGFSKSEESNTQNSKIYSVANELVEELTNYDKIHQTELKQLISKLKEKEEENQRLRKKLEKIHSLKWVDLPEVQKEKSGTATTIKTKGVQTRAPGQPLEKQGIYLTSFKVSLVNETIRKNIEKVSFQVKQLQTIPDPGYLSRRCTSILALKNKTSYLMVTSYARFIMVEDNRVTDEGRLPNPRADVKDAIYIPPLNCYLIDHNDNVYRKNLDGDEHLPPYVYLDWKCSDRAGCSFLYSKKNKKLILVKESYKIVLFNLFTKEEEVELKLGNPFPENIIGLKFLGKDEMRCIAASAEGFLHLISFNYEKNQGSILASCKTELFSELSQEFSSMAVCERGQYVFVEVTETVHGQLMSSSLMIFKIVGDLIFEEAILENLDKSIAPKNALECFGYIDGHILWIGLSGFLKGIAQIFDYDIQKKELKELKYSRKPHQEINPVRLHRLGRAPKWLYTGENGRLMQLNLMIEFNKKQGMDSKEARTRVKHSDRYYLNHGQTEGTTVEQFHDGAGYLRRDEQGVQYRHQPHQNHPPNHFNDNWNQFWGMNQGAAAFNQFNQMQPFNAFHQAGQFQGGNGFNNHFGMFGNQQNFGGQGAQRGGQRRFWNDSERPVDVARALGRQVYDHARPPNNNLF